MKLSDIDTSKYLYDPKRAESWMKLKKFKEFDKLKNPSKTIPYIILMYDVSNDQIRNEFPFYPNRKKGVCDLIGWKIDKEVEGILIGNDEDVNAMIVRYISLFNNPDLLNLASFYEIYVFLNKEAFSGKFDSRTITDIEKVNASIKQLTDNVFHGKDETELRMELYRTVREQALGIRPEEIAEKLSRGEDLLDGYERYKNYKVGDIKFLGDK
jgi:hypothetical protein